MPNIENINNSQSAKMGKLTKTNHQVSTKAAAAFVAAYKKAEKMIQVPESEKKRKQKENKKEKVVRKKKEEFEHHDEVDELLKEIDKRLEKLLQMAE